MRDRFKAQRVDPVAIQGQYAGIVSRILAFGVDLAIISVTLMVSWWLIGATLAIIGIDLLDCKSTEAASGLRQYLDTMCWLATVAMAAFTVLFGPLYFFVSWMFTGRTIGTGIFGMRVVDTDGYEIGGWSAALRVLGYGVCILTLGLGFLWAAVDSRRMGLHDKIARTVVIYDWPGRSPYANEEVSASKEKSSATPSPTVTT
jgi:uncharacterized RDD family membrane protein YckC